ncbi:YkvA family protein [Sabulibacter ruber]|uniref:YkvA family protein n=1 Tax=Sabulibacter ruber TaxID=2811901 RepID=UPI001A95959A|nr:YkvA family protein [Sabulibacter ruber]
MENQTNNTKNVHESSVFKRFLKSAEEYLKQPLRIKQLLNDAFRKATEKKDLGTIAGEVFENFSILLRMIKAAISGDYKGIPNNTIVMGVAVLIYFLSPIDLIPDWLPIIGLLDDASLLAWFMTTIKSEIDKFHAWEAAQPVRTTAADPSADLATAMSVDTSAHTPKYENEPAGQYGTGRETAPSNSGIGSSAQPQNPTYGSGNMQMGNDSTGSQGSTGGIIPNQNSAPVTSLRSVEGTPEQEIDPTSSLDARPTDHGVPTGYGEPNVRASTTDSTRVPSSNSYDTDHGGNVR